MPGSKPWQNGGKPSKNGKKNEKKKTLRKRRQSIASKEMNTQAAKVESIKLLVKKFEMSNIDALLAYDKFHKKYPSGEIKKLDFLEENKVKFCM